MTSDMLIPFGVTDRSLAGYAIVAVLLVAALGFAGYKFYFSHHRAYRRRMIKQSREDGRD